MARRLEAFGRASLAELVTIRLQENETKEGIALTPEQAQALQRTYLPEKLQVWRPIAGDHYNLRAGQYIGSIVLETQDGNVLRILIEPKVPITNLFYMLTYAHKLANFGRELFPLLRGEALFEFILRIFVEQVDEIVRRGIHRGYVDREEQAAYLRGRLLLARQLRSSAMAVDFHQQTNEFTADLLENRILRTVLAMLAWMPYEDTELELRVRRTLLAFSEVALEVATAADCDRVTYTRLNERYRSPINLARLFLRHLSLEGQTGETPFGTFLIPMYDLFELFVGRLLEKTLAAQPRFGVRTQDSIWLDEDRQLKGRPDIVLTYDNRPYLVLDTKYKVYGDRPTTSDYNQMHVYCHTLKVDRGVLIYPSDTTPRESLKMMSGVRLDIRSLSLTGPLEEFKARCQAFAEGFAEQLETQTSLPHLGQ